MNDIIEQMAARLQKMTCSGLIDQDCFIGGDPVGHKCSRDGVAWFWIDGLSWLVCAECHQMLRDRNGRVTLSPWRAKAGVG